MVSQIDWRDATTKHFKQRGGLETLVNTVEAENWAAMHEEQQKNREAESAWVRKNLWGAKEAEGEGEGDGMRQTIVGDVTNPTPIVVSAPNNGGISHAIMPLALGAALMGIPSAGVIGAALMSMQQSSEPAPKVQMQDETVNIGLGKIEDLLRDK